MESEQKIESTTPAGFSLLELMQHLRRVVAYNMTERVWVRAELSGVSWSKGSYYLTLVQRDEFQLRARVEGIVWAKVVDKLREKFAPTRPSHVFQAGQQLLMEVEVELHEQYGLKLSVQDVDLLYTIGEMEQRRTQVWERILLEGLQERNKAQKLPLLPRRIAVISSSQAAGYQDFIKQLHDNANGYSFETTLFENAMQGLHVSTEFSANIKKITAFQKDFDAVVVVRGGGAKLDLAAFDEYELCAALAACPLPVFTGIGHDIDESLADKIAFQALKTPTAVAEHFISIFGRADKQLSDLENQLKASISRRIQSAQAQLEQLEQQLPQRISQFVQLRQHILDKLEQQFQLTQPENTLKRGFAMLFDELGERISSSAQLQKGAQVQIQLADGRRVAVLLD